MPPKIHLFVIGQIAFDVVETEVDELLTTNHAELLSFVRPQRPFDGGRGGRLPEILPTKVDSKSTTLWRCPDGKRFIPRFGRQMSDNIPLLPTASWQD